MRITVSLHDISMMELMTVLIEKDCAGEDFDTEDIVIDGTPVSVPNMARFLDKIKRGVEDNTIDRQALMVPHERVIDAPDEIAVWIKLAVRNDLPLSDLQRVLAQGASVPKSIMRNL